MKKTVVFCGLFFLVVALTFGQSAGGGISFFFPESLLESSGSVSKEAGLSTSFSFGDFLAVPIGLTYIKASGFMPYDETGEDDALERMDDTIWYTADTFIPYLRLQAHIAAGSVFFEGFGGVAGAWIVAPQTFDGAVGRYYGSKASGVDYYLFEKLTTDISFGFGYQIGGSIGISIDALSISVEGILTDIRADTTLTSNDYYEADVASSSFNEGTEEFNGKFISRLRGISIGLNGQYAF